MMTVRRSGVRRMGFALIAATAACNQPQKISVDLSGPEPRFIIDHQGWPRPFWTPGVREFAVGTSEPSEPLWELRATTLRGRPADELAIVYGDVPIGFEQVYPPGGASPRPMVVGMNYLVAAAAGHHLYRLVVGVPPAERGVADRDAPTGERLTTSAPTRKSMAVVDFDLPATLPQEAGVAMADVCRRAVVLSQRYVLTDRATIRRILHEDGARLLTQCADTACVVQYGRQLGVQQVFIGRVELAANAVLVQLGVVDVQAGRLVARVSFQALDLLDARRRLPRRVGELLSEAASDS